jgi:very-short-patch-repair endonuclease
MGEGWEGVTAGNANAEMKKHPIAGARERARSLRRDMTDAEKSVWRIVRLYQIDGHRFRRQVPLGRYIADFVCHDARLIIEIDGGQHQGSAPQEAERACFLQDQGYRVLRFWNNEVLSNLEGVRAKIAETLRSHPLPTLPLEGEGFDNILDQQAQGGKAGSAFRHSPKHTPPRAGLSPLSGSGWNVLLHGRLARPSLRPVGDANPRTAGRCSAGAAPRPLPHRRLGSPSRPYALPVSRDRRP